MFRAEVFGGFNGGGGSTGTAGILTGPRLSDYLLRFHRQHGADHAPIVFVAHPVYGLLSRALGHKAIIAAVMVKVGGTDHFNL